MIREDRFRGVHMDLNNFSFLLGTGSNVRACG